MLREGEGFDHGLEELVISVVSLGSFTAQNKHKSAWCLGPRNKGVRMGGRLRFLVRCHAMWVSVLGQIDHISSVVRAATLSATDIRNDWEPNTKFGTLILTSLVFFGIESEKVSGSVAISVPNGEASFICDNACRLDSPARQVGNKIFNRSLEGWCGKRRRKEIGCCGSYSAS